MNSFPWRTTRDLVWRSRRPSVTVACALVSLVVGSLCAFAAEPVPHGQSKPPGPALSPTEAIAKMTVPEGFRVELVATEPDIVNPVAMTFDEQGRIWITESFEYPRLEAGPGRDRIKVLTDTDGDGRADKFTIFAEGLNIPSGIAVGAGGVWVANSPDILFLQDTDGDGRADKREVVVTGFGRDDTHELPNSLTWGPDGWLYGLNGVFNRSHVVHQGKEHRFTAAMFRIHPRTRAFELFAEGTSNPWGIAWDTEGSALLSACVIDHLWHLTQTGYYHRQAGAYPPFAWKIESIVDYRHQAAAYCGIHYFDSDAYPPEYRNQLYMGNIHGACINVDALERNGATYKGIKRPDFLTANDAWFMPVAQKTGPDGCLYVLDWYDRYHCYQDARRDPAGIDRGRGRLYRVRYKDSARAAPFDLTTEPDDQLIARLRSSNIYFRDIAQRLLAERNTASARPKLQALAFDASAPRPARMHALWALVSAGPLDDTFHMQLLAGDDAGFRAWGARAAGEMRKVSDPVRTKIVSLAADPAPDVRLQVAIAAAKLEGASAVDVLVDVLAHSSDDPLIPKIVWQNLHPRLEREGTQFITAISPKSTLRAAAVKLVAPRAFERLLACEPLDAAPIAQVLQLYIADAGDDAQVAERCLEILAQKTQTGEITGEKLKALHDACAPALASVLNSTDHELHADAALLAATWKNPAGLKSARGLLAASASGAAVRARALNALLAANDAAALPLVKQLLGEREEKSGELRRSALAALSRVDNPEVAELVIDGFAKLEPELQPLAIDLLASRASWSHDLLAAIEKKRIDRAALGANQVRKLLASDNEALRKQVLAVWGTVRTERDPNRERVIARTRRAIRAAPGDAVAGQAVFQKVCGNCHKMYGQGQEVGPDITVNGRGSFEQLLSNVLDPSLVIGAAYQAKTVVTDDGRVLTGLLVEDSPQRVVLKQQGGKTEIVPRDAVEEIATSRLSMMPEDLDRQLKPREMLDLFAYLVLDKPPADSAAKELSGVAAPNARESKDPQEFAEMVSEVAPGFTTRAVGEGGLALVPKHRGRPGVLRTHPPAKNKPCVLKGTIDVPAELKTRLVVEASHHDGADWQLVIRAGGKSLLERDVSAKTAPDGWLSASVDLTPFAGQQIDVELENRATGWSNEFGYWGVVDIISE
jgi:putative membrane-bound dehydrogenase-like protein